MHLESHLTKIEGKKISINIFSSISSESEQLATGSSGWWHSKFSFWFCARIKKICTVLSSLGDCYKLDSIYRQKKNKILKLNQRNKISKTCCFFYLLFTEMVRVWESCSLQRCTKLCNLIMFQLV